MEFEDVRGAGSGQRRNRERPDGISSLPIDERDLQHQDPDIVIRRFNKQYEMKNPLALFNNSVASSQNHSKVYQDLLKGILISDISKKDSKRSSY